MGASFRDLCTGINKEEYKCMNKNLLLCQECDEEEFQKAQQLFFGTEGPLS